MVCASALVTGHITNVNYQPLKSTFSILSFQLKKKVTSISKEEPENYRLAGHPHLDPWEGITRQGGVSDTPDSHAATQRNLDRLKK